MLFIPTYVGNTPWRWLPGSSSTVHPHVCGEHAGIVMVARHFPGSSPRMWGTLDNHNDIGRVTRFIPTYVGNTTSKCSAVLAMPVHPHVCGEHSGFSGVRWSCVGSSPRMWGTHRPIMFSTPICRFIPTYVGNTEYCIYIDPVSAVHPHVCGEHIFASFIAPMMRGSSPRMWGTPKTFSSKAIRRRFIPTYVGNTATRRAI